MHRRFSCLCVYLQVLVGGLFFVPTSYIATSTCDPDLAVCHPDGYAKITDRSKDIIISGGENISSLEVEDVLYKHPAVLTAAVVAKPDERWQEVPCAFIELKTGASVTPEEIIEHCQKELARFKVPKDVVITEIPKTSTGKLQKFILREWAKERA